MVWSPLKVSTFISSTLFCGINEPGMAPSDSRKSRIRATRIEVSWRQNQRAQPMTPIAGTEEADSSRGAVESCSPAVERSCSSVVFRLLMRLRSPQ